MSYERDGRFPFAYKQLKCISGTIITVYSYDKYYLRVKIQLVDSEEQVEHYVYLSHIPKEEVLSLVNKKAFFQMFDHNSDWAIYDYIATN